MKKKIFTLLTLLLCVCSAANATITAKWDWTTGQFSDVATIGQGSTGTLSSDVSGVDLYVDATATGAKLQNNPANAQFNTATKLQVPVVSTNDVLTVVANSYNFVNIKIGGNTYTTQSTTYNVTATDVAAGYVEIESTESPYLNSIQIVLAYMPSTTKLTVTWDWQNTIPSTITEKNSEGTKASFTEPSDVAGVELTVTGTDESTYVKLAYNASGYAQFNEGTIIKVPVTAVGDIITVVSFPGQYNFTVGGVAATANTTVYTATASDVATGYVAIVATSGSYLYSITLTKPHGVVTIGSTGWATYSNTSATDFTNVSSAVSAAIITGNTGTTINKTAVTGTVVANTGLLLNGAAGTYAIPVVSTGTDYSATNKLVAVASETSVTKAETGYTNYVLALSGEDAVFQYIDGTAATVGAGKAYLKLDITDPASAPILFLFDVNENTTTGIERVESPNLKTDTYFNLKGQRVAQPTKGLYIVNGKKVVIR